MVELMLDADARRTAEAIRDRAGATVTVTVGSNSTNPDGRPLPGGGRPTIVRYHIEVHDGRRSARLDLGDAEVLLDGLTEGCGAEALFAAIAARGIAVGEVSP